MQNDFREYAGFARRLAAVLIDTVFFVVVGFTLQLLILSPAQMAVSVNEGQLSFYSDASLWEQLMMAVVTVVLWVRLRGTPGKLLLDCQVVDAKSGDAVGWGQACIRYLSYLVSAIPLGLGFLWILWDKQKQGFHDKIAKTVVLHTVDHYRDDESTKSLDQLMREVR